MIINTLFGVSLKYKEHIPKKEENKNSPEHVCCNVIKNETERVFNSMVWAVWDSWQCV